MTTASLDDELGFIVDLRDAQVLSVDETTLVHDLIIQGRVLAVLDGPQGHALNVSATREGIARIWRDHKGPDGVLLHEPSTVDMWRHELGAQPVIGTYVEGTRHQSMVAAEQGADFLVLKNDAPDPFGFSKWWCALFHCTLGWPASYFLDDHKPDDCAPDMLLATPKEMLAVMQAYRS